jgi:signal transduction histidine kinase
MKNLLFILLCLSIPLFSAGAGDTTYVQGGQMTLLGNKKVLIFTDHTGKLPFEKIETINAFEASNQYIPNLGVSHAVFWLKFSIGNQSRHKRLSIMVKNPRLSSVRLYYPGDSGNYVFRDGGSTVPLSDHVYKNQNSIFNVPVPPGSTRTFYVRVRSEGEIVVPVYAGTASRIIENITMENLTFGMYAGLILIMIFYNLFVYFTVRDKAYVFYIIYIFCVGLAQLCLQGFGFRLIWGASSFISVQSINWSGSLVGIATALFARVFLHTREKEPVYDKVLIGFVVVDTVNIALTLVGLYNVSYVLIDVVAFTGALTILWIAVKLARQGVRTAKFFLIAWTFFLLSVIVFVVRDFGLIPYNFFTSHILLIGSSVEVALLSFALADKINTYKKEKEISQANALRSAQEKEQFVKEQNIILESKINERTQRLQEINTELKNALKHLKDTQSQLVDAEKMASLGQLTAGIAHEINNPINFVKSNIKPLKLDISDVREVISKYEEITAENLIEKLDEIRAYKEEIEFDYVVQEIETLLTGIDDGANRTAEIVRGLRTFSRLDESELKEADIEAGLDTTLMLLTSNTPKRVHIEKSYCSLPRIECLPGKLNQVFMNILVNALQAIKSKEEQGEEKISITTEKHQDVAVLRIADTGPGIPPSIKGKIFDPFFTTKDVGEGTGLGLSIAYSIIEKHHGKIEVFSEQGSGTEFVITLPLRQGGEPLKDNWRDMETSDREEKIH